MDAILLAFTTLVTAFGAIAPESPGAAGTRIVFTAIPDPSPGRGPQCGNRGDPEIFTVFPDGSGLRRLTDNRMHESTPAWSPDHTRIVFGARPPMHRDPAVDDDLFVMKADGTGVRRLTDGPGQDWAPEWSPDGQQIAFVRQLPGRPGVSSSDDRRGSMVVGLDGSGLRQLSPPRRYAGALTPGWSPDGQQIAFVRDEHPGPISRLVAGEPGGTERTVVEDRKAELSFPDWSPDGRWIVYSTFRRTARLERVRADGSGREVLTEDWWTEATAPSWSPRGDRIAYVGTIDGCQPHVYRMTAAGRRQRDLLDGEDLEVYSLDW